jgi:hypothetical protein
MNGSLLWASSGNEAHQAMRGSTVFTGQDNGQRWWRIAAAVTLAGALTLSGVFEEQRFGIEQLGRSHQLDRRGQAAEGR